MLTCVFVEPGGAYERYRSVFRIANLAGDACLHMLFMDSGSLRSHHQLLHRSRRLAGPLAYPGVQGAHGPFDSMTPFPSH